MPDSDNVQKAGSPEKALEEIAVESWRFSRLFLQLLAQLDGGNQSRYQNQLRFFLKKLEDGLQSADLRIVNLEGQEYDPGLAATPLNIEDFDADTVLVVDQMIEPTIMGPDGLIRSGTVILREASQ